MKIVGIIIEANPFHKGHKYLIDKVQSDLQPDILIACISGYFSMRGEISVLSKLNKCDILLENGFDLVLELPISHALNSADLFASSSIQILSKIGITHLAFGIENGSIEQFNKIIEIENNSNFNDLFTKNLKSTNRYKQAYFDTINQISNESSLGELTLLPNNTLALSYIRALQGSNIQPYSIDRVGSNDLEENLSSFPSGTALRKAIQEQNNIQEYINFDTNLISNIKDSDSKLKTLLLNCSINHTNRDNILHISEGIDNYIFNNYDFNLSFEENLNKLANKRYSKSKLRRVIISLLLQIPNNLINESPDLRILGFSSQGINYLKRFNDINFITNIKNINNKFINEEIKAVKLYSILTNKDYLLDEYKFPRKVQ